MDEIREAQKKEKELDENFLEEELKIVTLEDKEKVEESKEKSAPQVSPNTIASSNR